MITADYYLETAFREAANKVGTKKFVLCTKYECSISSEGQGLFSPVGRDHPVGP